MSTEIVFPGLAILCSCMRPEVFVNMSAVKFQAYQVAMFG